MKKLKLVLEDCGQVGWEKIRRNTENFTRKYFSIEIQSAYEIDQETVTVMSKHVELRQLELFACLLEFKHHKGLTQILQKLRKLEVLKFMDTEMDVSDEKELREIEDVQLPNLKTVVLHDSSAAVSSKRIRIVVQWNKFFHFLLVLSVPEM